MKVRKAVIPAAGYGTRFLPATKNIPKEMLPIVDKPAIQYIVEEAVNAGIEEILIINGRNKGEIEDHFDRTPELEAVLLKSGKQDLYELIEAIPNLANIHFFRQKEAKGLGHAVLCAKAFVGDEPFVVLLGDDIVANDVPCTKQLIDAYDRHQCSILGVQTVDHSQVSKYGIVDGVQVGPREYKVKDLVEKPAVDEAPSNVAILGRYILTPEIFNILEGTKPGKNDEIQLTDALRSLLKIEDIVAYDFEGHRYDTGDKLGFLQATVEFGLKHPEVAEGLKMYIKELAETL